jgi:hypothetical protein
VIDDRHAKTIRGKARSGFPPKCEKSKGRAVLRFREKLNRLSCRIGDAELYVVPLDLESD